MEPGSLVRSRTVRVLAEAGIALIRCSLRERTVQANFNQADFAAVRIDIIDGLLNGVTNGTHCNDNVLCVRSAIVVEQFVVGADFGVDFVHVLLYDCGNRVIVGVAGLTSLEEDVGVLSGTTQNRMVRVQRTVFERFDSVHIQHIAQVLVVPDLESSGSHGKYGNRRRNAGRAHGP